MSVGHKTSGFYCWCSLDISEAKLEATKVHGFPVVSVNQDRTLLGYIGRTELTYLLGVLAPPIRSPYLTWT